METDPEPLCETVPRQTFSGSSGAPSGGAIFRYRSYEESVPDWVSDLETTSLDLREGGDLVTTYRGPEVFGISPFRSRPVTRFEAGDYWLSENVEGYIKTCVG